MNFVPLHSHFEDSYLDGAIRFRDLNKIKKKGINAIANTAHGNLSGSYEFYKEAKKIGMKPIIGIEFYWAIDRTAKGKDELENSRPNYHMIALAKNKNGYQTLSKLSSKAYDDGFYYSPRIDNKLLELYNKDIICTSGCLGSIVNQYILKQEYTKAENYLSYYKELFGTNNYFVELQVHNMEDQKVCNEQLLKLADKLQLPIIITSDSHYMDCCDKQLHDKFLAISTNAKLDNPKRFTFGELECHIPTYDEMILRCDQNNIPQEAVSNTKYISDMIIDNYFEGTYNQWPRFPKIPDNQTSHDYLADLVFVKWLEKFNREPTQEEIERISYELKVIKKMDFSDYMLILWDMMEYCKTENILTGPGRGSAAGSMVAYLLGITRINPMKYGLLFERFLNSGRSSTPLIF